MSMCFAGELAREYHEQRAREKIESRERRDELASSGSEDDHDHDATPPEAERVAGWLHGPATRQGNAVVAEKAEGRG